MRPTQEKTAVMRQQGRVSVGLWERSAPGQHARWVTPCQLSTSDAGPKGASRRAPRWLAGCRLGATGKAYSRQRCTAVSTCCEP